MTRLQSTLLFVLAALALLVAGRMAWDGVLSMAAAAGTVAAALPGLARSVPGWAWWTAFSAVWWLPCALGRSRWRCGSSTCSARLT